MLRLDHFGLTDAGKVRENNEDALLSGGGRDPALFAVADGIGGFEAGEVASSIAIESLQKLEPGGSLEAAIQEANHRIYSASRDDEKLSSMGTTLVAARLTENGGGVEAEVSHVGDSRVYLLRDGNLEPLTEDHSLVAELVRSGSLTRSQASEHPQKNLITRALGAEDEVEVESSRHRLQQGDRIVLCSDGLSDLVSESAIAELISADSAQSAEKSARNLISAALDAGGTDNVTAVVVDINDAQRPGSDATRSLAADTAEPATHVREQRASEAEAPRAKRDSPGSRRSRKRRGKDREAARRSPSDRAPGKSRWKKDGNYTRLRKGESLIPGVWDGAVVEEPEPREPTPEEVVEQFRVRPAPDVRETREDPRRRRRRKRLARSQKAISALIRGLAALAVLGLLLVPPYLWWSTRYFMAYEGEEIVIHQGVPYDFLGNELNRVDQRTGVQRTDIAEPYRDQVRENKLYTEDRLQTVLEDLQKR